jgi:hypothetical protein
MMNFLLAGLASFGLSAADTQGAMTVTCTATATGPTFGLNSGTLYFHFVTTCDAPVEAMTINAFVDGPKQDRSGTKTCTYTDSCSYIISMYYSRGTWLWTNDTAYTGGTSSATNTVTYYQ